MKKKFWGILLAAMCVCVFMAGCTKEEKEESADKKEKKETVKEVQEKEYETIGSKAEGAYEVLITNAAGQDITGIAVKSTDKTEWPGNMIPSGKTFKKDQTVRLYYTPEKDSNTAVASDKAVKPSFDVNLTLADGKTYQLSGFPFEDMEEVSVKIADDVAFLEYTSKTSKEQVSTKEQELGLKAQREQEAAARAAAEKAAADTQAAADAQAQRRPRQRQQQRTRRQPMPRQQSRSIRNPTQSQTTLRLMRSHIQNLRLRQSRVQRAALEVQNRARKAALEVQSRAQKAVWEACNKSG
ncbi:hypothetical protein [Luxibacter massiliensis]|uniref:hypothetical protein n=1 Tax=Luxibacter massiliensis TaxID=2219695 RepID=UPI000F06A6AE|nr:hypothetical protein [Luxibacter massiliensis]